MKKAILFLMIIPNFAAFSQKTMKRAEELEKYIPKSAIISSTKDSYNLVDSIINFHFNSISDSVVNNKIYYGYNFLGQKISESFFKRDSLTNHWNEYKYEYTLDSTGHIFTTVYSFWIDTAAQWTEYSLCRYKYDSSGKQINRLIYLNPYTQSPSYLDSYTYDSIGNKISDTTYIYIFSKWYPSTIEEYSYDFERNLTSDKFSTIEDLTHQWLCRKFNKYEYSYNSNELIDTLELYYYDFQINQWLNDLKAEYSYDAAGRQESRVYSIRDSTSNQLVNADKIENIYDLNGNKTLETGYIWDKIQNIWVFANKKYFYYSLLNPVGINNKTIPIKIPYQLFQNQAREKVSIEIHDKSVNRAILYSTNGQLIKAFFIHQGLNILNIDQLSKGFYIIQIPTQKGINTLKLVKE
jgi:hypothetical protein